MTNTLETLKNFPKRKRLSVLKEIGCKKILDLTPRKKKMYFLDQKHKMQICKLKNKLQKSKNQLKVLSDFSKTSWFQGLENNLDQAVLT